MAKTRLAARARYASKSSNACRVFQEDLVYKSLESREKHTFQINLEAMWEDRFRMLAYRAEPRVISAVADSGEELRRERIPAAGISPAMDCGISRSS